MFSARNTVRIKEGTEIYNLLPQHEKVGQAALP